jgi:hypothetical protein
MSLLSLPRPQRNPFRGLCDLHLWRGIFVRSGVCSRGGVAARGDGQSEQLHQEFS